MGWGNCGTDSQGRPIGYYHPATCDEPGCEAEIDRGLSFACGGMHGEDEYSCEKYFCDKHKEAVYYFDEETGGEHDLCDGKHVCKACETIAIKHFEEYEKGKTNE